MELSVCAYLPSSITNRKFPNPGSELFQERLSIERNSTNATHYLATAAENLAMIREPLRYHVVDISWPVLLSRYLWPYSSSQSGSISVMIRILRFSVRIDPTISSSTYAYCVFFVSSISWNMTHPLRGFRVNITDVGWTCNNCNCPRNGFEMKRDRVNR